MDRGNLEKRCWRKKQSLLNDLFKAIEKTESSALDLIAPTDYTALYGPKIFAYF